MKINMRILFQEDAKSPLQKTGVFSNEELEGTVLDLDTGSEKFPLFLEATMKTTGSWFNPVITFSEKELNNTKFFELQCRKTLPENNCAMQWNEDHLQTLELLPTSAGRKIRLPYKLAVSNVTRLKQNMVSGVGQSMAEFVAHTNVTNQFLSEDLSGFSLCPVFHPKTAIAHEEVVQLYCESIMPKAEVDKTILPADCGGIRRIGCLSYTELDSETVSDFNRTAEDWSSQNMPFWVVSQKVRQCFKHHKFKGCAFQPVLEAGTPLHDEYQRQWNNVFANVAQNPLNFF